LNKHDYVSPAIAKQQVGVHSQTLRRWARRGLIPFIVTPTGQHRYCLGGLIKNNQTSQGVREKEKSA
jgi:predicted site-specific integrase-resolvase